MPPDLATVLDEAATALNEAMVEEPGLLDETIRLYAGTHTMWRDRVERTLKAVTDPAAMSTPTWSAGRPARWLLTSYPDAGQIGVTASGSALALYLHGVPPRDRPRRVLVPCPVELVDAFEEQD